jgi:peptide/nickel transport system substrate-binding protein
MRRLSWMVLLVIGVAASGQVLKVAFDAADLRTLDPHYAAATMDRAVVDMVFNGLVRYKPGDITVIEPDLAERWEVSPDGKTWTFYLRKGVRVHPFPGAPDGYELTAEDVVFSLTKAADPKRSAYAGEYTGMTFEAVDQYTVRITLAQALSPSLFLPKVADYAGGFIIPKQAYEALGDRFATNPVGTGPFRFVRHVPAQKVELAAFDGYFRGKPKLAGVEVWYMPDVTARLSALATGEVHLIEGVREQAWVLTVKRMRGIVVDVFGPGETHVLHLNMTKPPLDNPLVRQAIAYTLSRTELITAIGPDIAEPLCGLVPVYLAGGLSCDEAAARGVFYEADLAKARALLAQAGYPDGFALSAYITERASYRKPFENIQAQLARVGIQLEIKVTDHASFHSLIRKDVNPLVHYEAWRPSADSFLTRFYHSESIVVTGKKPDTNFSHVTAADGLIEAARVALDPNVQVALWKDAQEVILREVAALPFYVLKFVFARSDRLQYGYELKSSLALYPPINELTTLR